MVEAVSNYHDLVRSDVFALVPQNAGRLLDLGGGIGATGAALKELGRASEVIVIDHVTSAWAKGVDKGYVADLEDTDFLDDVLAENAPFDTILCLDVLEHLRDPWGAIKHVHKSLRPGGVMVISLPNVNHWSLVGPLLLQGRFNLVESGVMDRTHIRWFARHGVIELATSSGLVCEEIQTNIGRRLHKVLDKVSFGLLRRFVAVQYVVRVRRPA
ncbi:class I SAM-dependent methyltransferase [Novosphingobium sp. G106]|uniref:class I SAM-dependent methyltransferase n=1 Tax=Novosphingobium sp. G106 TaxID=2849500 RepID=UPI001C2D025B|nr:methyltransferase domain-containing protein [Novosphingobium sp. G106]MBV1692164.1 class I SAM-dependent methyltransferase [Novosphingobium sp. G106]MBV1692433.1 class I SAM-dependent methyltransferase [Novosphingobium sp. G106]